MAATTNLTDPTDNIRAALDSSDAASKAWEKLSPSCRREYLEWIDEAKKPETRARRIARTLEMVKER